MYFLLSSTTVAICESLVDCTMAGNIGLAMTKKETLTKTGNTLESIKQKTLLALLRDPVALRLPYVMYAPLWQILEEILNEKCGKALGVKGETVKTGERSMEIVKAIEVISNSVNEAIKDNKFHIAELIPSVSAVLSKGIEDYQLDPKRAGLSPLINPDERRSYLVSAYVRCEELLNEELAKMRADLLQILLAEGALSKSREAKDEIAEENTESESN